LNPPPPNKFSGYATDWKHITGLEAQMLARDLNFKFNETKNKYL
jgi:hypothetical protein